MSTIAKVEKALRKMPVKDARQVAGWLQHYLDEQWNKQIDGDIDAGHLDQLSEKALDHYRAGRVNPADEIIDHS